MFLSVYFLALFLTVLFKKGSWGLLRVKVKGQEEESKQKREMVEDSELNVAEKAYGGVADNAQPTPHSR